MLTDQIYIVTVQNAAKAQTLAETIISSKLLDKFVTK